MAASRDIQGTRLVLQPFAEAHLTPRYVAWLNDPQVVRFSEQRFRQHSLESCREYWKSFDGTPHFFWAIVAGGGLGHIGNMNAYLDDRNGVADLGILIGERAAWRRGFGLEAWLAACGYLFGECGIRKITAGTLASNVPMLSIMQRAGMVEDGRRVRQCLWEGQAVDICHGALFRDRRPATEGA